MGAYPGDYSIAGFLICADSAVLISRKPIRTQVLNMLCDKHVWGPGTRLEGVGSGDYYTIDGMC